jgi:GTP-binding protein HflX
LGRLRGLRLIHTHLKGEPLSADDLNDLALLRLDLVAVVGVDGDGSPGRVDLAHVLPLPEGAGSDSVEPFRRISAPSLFSLDFDCAENIRALEREFVQPGKGWSSDPVRERALIIGVQPDDDRFEELLELVRSARVMVAGQVRQRRPRLHSKTVVGAGKLRQIVLEGMRRQAEVAIFDVELKPAQARAFEDATGLKAIDRTQLILDIFAQRAKSRDGKLQVELAQLKYSLPRLTEKDEGLSRLVGGIGGRGPGETVLEVGRRRIYDRIRRLEKQVAQLSKQRDVRRARRKKNNLPVLSLIGYTNAGKTTLLNALTESHVEADDRLFATLDPTVRRLRFPRKGEVVITDTVGFLRDLPEDLVTAFRATLEELGSADVLLHVVDASDEQVEMKMQAVLRLLTDLQLQDIPRLVVLNKCDLIGAERMTSLVRRWGGIPLSAATRRGLEGLLEAAEERLQEELKTE